MKRLLKSRWVWVVSILVIVPFAGWLILRHETVNEMYLALDKLASIPLENRWSQPEMIKIRQLGPAAIPPLRRVLQEKDRRATRFLLWLETKWPSVTRYYSHMPDSSKMTERRWTACQVLATLGPTAKPAIPEIIQVMESKDPADVNAGSMALWAAGIDADACERLDESLEKGRSGSGRISIVNALGNVKPPSARTLNVLTKELQDASPYISEAAAEALGRLGVAAPAVIDGLNKLQRSAPNELTAITCSAALWQLQHDQTAATNVFCILEGLLQKTIPPPIGGGNGGQGVDAIEQSFMKGAELLEKMPLAEAEKRRALGIMGSFCDKSGRIFVRMLLLPAMMDLGLPREKCFDVCMTGLSQNEDYYRLQAARLLVGVAGKFPTNEINVDDLVHDRELGVRVYAAKIHWQNRRSPEVVVPILADALNRPKYQSYYYPEILTAALTELGDIGSQAGEARTNVAALRNDPDAKVAQLATDTLGRMDR